MTKSHDRFIYKLLLDFEWRDFEKNGAFQGSPIDLRDGYIHFSPKDHTISTANKYFADANPLIIAQIDSTKCPKEIIWEPARGGILFPHLYDILPLDAVNDFRVMTRDDHGEINWPDWITG